MTGYSLKSSRTAPSTFAVFIFYVNETNEGRMHQHSPYVEKNNALEAHRIAFFFFLFFFARLGMRQADLSVQVKVTMKSSYNIEIEE